MLLPLPARCASCAAGAENCPRCAAKADNAAGHTVAGACCERRASAGSTCIHGVAHSDRVGADDCTCVVSPVQRALPREKLAMPTQDLLAALPFAALLPADIATENDFVAIKAVGLAPSIPHRILHCSWLI
jgi:hypothetical protein